MAPPLLLVETESPPAWERKAARQRAAKRSQSQALENECPTDWLGAAMRAGRGAPMLEALRRSEDLAALNSEIEQRYRALSTSEARERLQAEIAQLEMQAAAIIRRNAAPAIARVSAGIDAAAEAARAALEARRRR